MAPSLDVPDQTLSATPKLGPVTVECRFEGFEPATIDTLSSRLSPFACEQRLAVRARIRGGGKHRFLYSDKVISDVLGTHVVRHDFWAQKTDTGWEGAALDSPVAAESCLRWLTAIELLERGGLLLHASSATIGGEGHLFLGASGAGKSTIISEGGFDSVLCEEISILAPGEEGTQMLWPSPFWGIGHIGELVEPAPLSAIWELFGWEKTATVDLQSGDALLAVYRRVVDIGAAAFSPRQVLDIVATLVENVPVRRLSWRRGESLLEALGT